MPFNVVADPLFPILTRSGASYRLSYSALAACGGDYPVDFDWPRADFNIASFELAVGLTTLALQPVDETEWKGFWQSPPTPAAIQQRLDPYRHAFELDGDGPRFLQDREAFDGEANPIEALLIDTPGANGQKKNADLLTHRDRYAALGLPAAAMALHALQQFAPSGGAGNRTSMRGGGPLTTLVMPGAPAGERPPLWRCILANVVGRRENKLDLADLPRALPWLAPTRVSDKASGERTVHESENHPLQCFFGMPRRIRLVIDGQGTCPMTGVQGPLATGFVQKPWGVNYGLWTHPLTPYRRQKEADPAYSVKPKTTRFFYRDWAGVAVRQKDARALPAANVEAARSGRQKSLRGEGWSNASLRVAGWAMNNMEAIGYLFSEQPLHLASSERAQGGLDEIARNFAEAAIEVASALRSALRAALFAPGATVSTDSGFFEEARVAFYDATEADFHDRLDDLLGVMSEDGSLDHEEAARAWLEALSRAARAIFAEFAPVPLEHAERANRIADAASLLAATLKGRTKQGKAIFGVLALEAPETGKKVKGGSK